MDMKKRAVKILVFIILLIAIILISLLFLMRNKDINLGNNNIGKDYSAQDKTVNNNQNNNNQTTPSNDNKDSISSSSGGGGGAGSGGDNKQSSGICSTNQISYSMTDFNKTSTCNNYQSSICIDKTVSCSVKIQNRDNEITGFFGVELIFLEKGKNIEEAFNSSSSRLSLSPMRYEFLSDSIDITSSGQDGLANKEIDCFYTTVEVPKKQVCV